MPYARWMPTVRLINRGKLVPILLSSISALSCGKSDDQLFRDHDRRGDAFLQQHKPNEAIIEYRIATQLAPQSGPTRKKLGHTYLDIGDQSHALVEFARAADLLLNDVDVQLTTGRLYLLGGRFGDASRCADRVLGIDGRNVDAVLLRGSALVGLRDLDGAVANIEHAIALDPTESRAYSALGGVELSNGQITQADAAFRKAIELAPNSARAHIALGYFFWTTRRVADAEAVFEHAHELEPQNALVNRILASLFLSTKRIAEAEPYLKALAQTEGYKLALADYYLAQRRFHEAEQYLVSIVSDRSIANQVALRFAAIRLAEGRTKEASEAVDSVLRDQPSEPSALLAKAQVLVAQDRVAEAIPTARAVAERDPNNLSAHFLLGQLYSQGHEARAAITEFQDVLRLNPLAVAAQVELARLYLAVGDSANARHAADEALRATPDDPEVRVLLARSLLNAGETSRAELEIQQLVRTYPEASSVQALAGAMYRSKQNETDARRSLELALKLDSSNREALTDLVLLNAETNHLAEAHRLIADRLAKTPNDAELMLLAARTYTSEGNLPSAEELLKRVISQDAANISAYGLLGNIYLSERRLESARIEFEKAVSKNPQSVAANTIVAMILEAQNKFEEATSRYQRILEIDANAVVAANNLACLYVDKGYNIELALKLAQRAKQGLPADPRVNDTIGWIYYKKNLPQEAIAALQESVARDPSVSLHQYHLGMAYIQAHDYPKARPPLEKALLNPSFPGVDEARRALSMIGG
jgi:tetratricopeptide (TPR) repeat protein